MTHPIATKTNFTKQSNELFKPEHAKILKHIGRSILTYLSTRARLKDDDSNDYVTETTYVQIREACGIGSDSTVSKYLKILIDNGYLSVQKVPLSGSNAQHMKCIYKILDLPEIAVTNEDTETKDVAHLTKAKVEKKLAEISEKQNQPMEVEGTELYKQHEIIRTFCPQRIDFWPEAQFYRVASVKGAIAKHGVDLVTEAYIHFANYCKIQFHYGRTVKAGDYILYPEKIVEKLLEDRKKEEAEEEERVQREEFAATTKKVNPIEVEVNRLKKQAFKELKEEGLITDDDRDFMRNKPDMNDIDVAARANALNELVSNRIKEIGIREMNTVQPQAAD